VVVMANFDVVPVTKNGVTLQAGEYILSEPWFLQDFKDYQDEIILK
jgi:hypothetical protein